MTTHDGAPGPSTHHSSPLLGTANRTRVTRQCKGRQSVNINNTTRTFLFPPVQLTTTESFPSATFCVKGFPLILLFNFSLILSGKYPFHLYHKTKQKLKSRSKTSLEFNPYLFGRVNIWGNFFAEKETMLNKSQSFKILASNSSM